MDFVDFRIRNRTAYITLNRVEKRNALNRTVVDQLTSSFLRANQDSSCKILVLEAKGKVFSAGADLEYLQELQKNTYQENLEDSNSLMELFQTIYTLDKPVIAKVQGHAIAGGCGLASVCDFVVAQSEARFGYTEVRIGFVPAIVMVYLLRRLGEGHARDLLLSGRLISAREAMDIGLVNHVVEADSLETFVDDLANQMAAENSAESMKRIKSMISRIPQMGLKEALAFAVAQNAETRSTDDCKRGIKAFLDKTSPSW